LAGPGGLKNPFPRAFCVVKVSTDASQTKNLPDNIMGKKRLTRKLSQSNFVEGYNIEQQRQDQKI
jgi:hypothetical protein